MIRAVPDTNVLVSIALPGGRLRSLVDGWHRGRYRPLISSEIFEEYLRVLTYPKFQLTSDNIRHLLEGHLLPHAETVRMTSRITAVANDPSDDKFLACAVDGRATWLVTGDHHLLRLGTFRGVRIGPPVEFLRALR